MGAAVAWLSSVRDDITLLIGEYLPEILLVSVVLVAFWILRKRFRRNARQTH